MAGGTVNGVERDRRGGVDTSIGTLIAVDIPENVGGVGSEDGAQFKCFPTLSQRAGTT